MERASSAFLVVLHGDEHTDLSACCTADKVVIFGIDLREGGGVILALVPQVHLHIVGKLIALGAAHGRGRAQLVDVDGDQLHHRLHGAGGAGADSDAAGQDRVLHRGLVADGLAIDIAAVGDTLGHPAQHAAHGAAGVVSGEVEQIAGEAAGAGRQALPDGRADAAVHDAPQDLAGGGEDDVIHVGDDLAVRLAGSGRGGGGVGIGEGGLQLGIDLVAHGGGEVLHVVQHTVSGYFASCGAGRGRVSL